jgi:hypothetical protein
MAYDKNQFVAGMEVIDAEGSKVGNLVRYDDRLGYFETQGTFSGPRYLPFHAIESILPDRIRLNVTKDVVSIVYKRMPEARPELSASGVPTGATVASGYDLARRVPLDAAQLGALREQIQEGTPVFDEFDEKLGPVEAYDPETGYMRIDEGKLMPKPLFLPATAVAYLDDRGIHLSVAKDDIASRYTVVPAVAQEFFAR